MFKKKKKKPAKRQFEMGEETRKLKILSGVIRPGKLKITGLQ